PTPGETPVTTARQIRSNQQNSTRSTGPKSPEGRDRTRRNALKHGLAAEILLPEEQQAEADRRAASWGPGLGVTDDLSAWLADQVAAESVRIDACRQRELALQIK